MGGLALTRGDVVIVADGKPRPAVVVQADAILTPTLVLICPLTSDLTDAPLYRVTVEPSPANGLRATSQLMTDRTGPVRRDRIGGIVGRLNQADAERLNAALILILDLSD